MAVEPESTRQLLQSAVAGDRAALQGLLITYYSDIEAAIRPRFSPELANHVEIEDLIQDVLVDVYRGIGSYKETESGSFVAWLNRVAENRVIDTVRGYRRVKRGADAQRVEIQGPSAEDSLNEIWDWICEDVNPPDRPVRLEEARQAIQVSLASLQADQREAVIAHYFEHLKTDEAALRMGRSPGAIRELMRRARENLKKHLGSASAWLSTR